jgi:pilus assembly protein TadC
MPHASGPALPDIATALASRRGDGAELRRVTGRIDEMVTAAGFAALDAALALAEGGIGAREAARRIAEDIAGRTEALEREVSRVVRAPKPA